MLYILIYTVLCVNHIPIKWGKTANINKPTEAEGRLNWT